MCLVIVIDGLGVTLNHLKEEVLVGMLIALLIYY